MEKLCLLIHLKWLRKSVWYNYFNENIFNSFYVCITTIVIKFAETFNV